MRLSKIALLLAAFAPAAVTAQVRITEFMYQGVSSGAREFFEITNLGAAAVDVSGWSYNDSNAADPVSFASVGFGSIGAGESVVFTELTAAAFRAYWNLASSVQVYSIGGDSNLGASDAVNIYNSTTQSGLTLVDGVSYSGTTAGISRNRPLGVTGAVTNAGFVNAAVGDGYGSHYAGAAGASDLANPGSFGALAAVPEPASWAMMLVGFALAGTGMRLSRRRTIPAFD